MPKTIYVGRFTWSDLRLVEQGITTLEYLLYSKEIHDDVCKTIPSRRDADREISMHETLSVLIPLEKRSPRALIITLHEYQEMLNDIERNPGLFNTEHLTPEIAQAWYLNQILAIRRLLQH